VTHIKYLVHFFPGYTGFLFYQFEQRGCLEKIIFYNLITALATIVGAILTYFLRPFLPDMFVFFALSVAAGIFIYISTSDLIPELREESNGGFDIGHTLALLFGIISVALISSVL